MTDEDRLRFEDDELRRTFVSQPPPSLHGHDWAPYAQTPLDVALVGCSSLKQQTGGAAVPAKILYRGRLCQLGYAHAQAMGWDVHFLSALHGLVEPNQLLVPYNFSIAHLLQSEQQLWAKRIVAELLALYPLVQLHLRFLVGRAYIRPIVQLLEAQTGYWTWEVPLDGLDLFARFRWFENRRQWTSGDDLEARPKAHAQGDVPTPRITRRGHGAT